MYLFSKDSSSEPEDWTGILAVEENTTFAASFFWSSVKLCKKGVRRRPGIAGEEPIGNPPFATQTVFLKSNETSTSSALSFCDSVSLTKPTLLAVTAFLRSSACF